MTVEPWKSLIRIQEMNDGVIHQLNASQSIQTSATESRFDD